MHLCPLFLYTCMVVLHADKPAKGAAAATKQTGKDNLKRTSTYDALAERREAGRRELSEYTGKLLSRFDSATFFDSGKDSTWSDAAFGMFFDKAVRAADDTVQVRAFIFCSPWLNLKNA